MQVAGYDRYGLSGNPFREISSEVLDAIDIFHVNQKFDDKINLIKDEVFSKQNKAVIAVTGDIGVGKTHRLLLVANEAKLNKSFYVFVDIVSQSFLSVKEIINRILERTKQSDLKNRFSSPKWYRTLTKLKRDVKKNQFKPELVGRAIAEALNSTAPSYLLLNDIHNISPREIGNFLKVLFSIIDNSNPGVLFMFSCRQIYYQKLITHYPSVKSKLNFQVEIPAISNSEAILLLGKRMLGRRMVDQIDPLFPFTTEAVCLLNEESSRNPKKLLELAAVIIDSAAQRRVMSIGESVTRDILNIGQHKPLEVGFEQDLQKDISEPEISPSQNTQPTRLPTDNIDYEPTNLTNENKSFEDSQEIPEYVSNNPSINPTCNQSNIPTDNPSNVSSNNPGNEKNNPSSEEKNEDKEPKTIMKPTRRIRAKCPNCGQVFSFEIDDSAQKLRCPNPDCDFIGSVRKRGD
jgi:hypothetical protein